MTKPAFTAKLLKDVDMRFFDELKKRLVGDGKVVHVGVPQGKDEPDGTPLALIAAVHEYGSPTQGIPERPVYRVFVKKHRDKYVRFNRLNLVKMARGEIDAATALGQLGEMAKGDVQNEIRNGDFTSLKPATVRHKGSSRPLIDTGQYIQSISWQLGKKDD